MATCCTIKGMDNPNRHIGRASESRLHNLGGGFLRSAVTTVVFVFGVVGVAAMLNTFVFQSYYVEGLSMTPTLQDNDRLVVSKLERTVSDAKQEDYIPERGQIVVLDQSASSLGGAENEELIKRVVGLPGDRIEIQDGTVTVFNAANPAGFDVDRRLGLSLGPTYTERGGASYSVGVGEVFVLGDNRGPGGSYDSRVFGAVDTGKIVGRLWLRILPLDKAGVF